MTHVGIILAAGASTRMGRPKALLELDGQPLIAHHLQAMAPWCRDLIVVLGAHAEEIGAILPQDVQSILNPAWARTGPAESLALAMAHTNATRAWVTPVDVPPAPQAVLSALAAHPGSCVPTHAGESGHPVQLDLVEAQRALPGQTLREVLAGATRVPVEWPDTTLNLNTPEAWAQWCATRDPSGQSSTLAASKSSSSAE
jgi:nicotine blue oxidoreductase